MSKVTGKLVVFFEDPFWVGVFERIESEKLSVAKITFGAEPKDYEVWEFVLKYYDQIPFSPTVEIALNKNRKKDEKNTRDIKGSSA